MRRRANTWNQAGVRRSESAGKPAVIYELNPEAEPLLSRAYAPVLGALLEVIGDELDPRTAKRVLRETGKRLAAASGGRASGDLVARGRAAAAVLTALGGEVEVEKQGNTVLLYDRLPLPSLDTPTLMARRFQAMRDLAERATIKSARSTLCGARNCMEGLLDD